MAAPSPEVILSSNVPHYRYAAYGLAEEGRLKRYICAIAVQDEPTRLYRLLSPYWRKKLAGRRLQGLPREKVHSIWSSELLQKGLPRLKLLSTARANWLSNRLYDRIASRAVEPVDIFHFSTGVGLASAQRAKALGATIICDVRTEHPGYQSAILHEEAARLGMSIEIPDALDNERVAAELALADYIVVPSTYALETFAAAGLAEERLYAVPPGVDLSLFHRLTETGLAPARSDADETFRVIFSGQVIPRKGLHYLVDAFSMFDVPNAELLLAGRIDPSMREWLRTTAARDERVRALGSVPQVALPDLYRRSSVFVLPSLSDSWGLVTLEAMAVGLPIIVTQNTGSREAVREGVDGFVVPIRDPQAIAEKLWLLYEQPDLRQRMGASAAERSTQFSWKHYGINLLSVYNEVAQPLQYRKQTAVD